MPFPRALAWNEMQAALSSTWTWVVNSISYVDDYYTKCVLVYVYLQLCDTNNWLVHSYTQTY